MPSIHFRRSMLMMRLAVLVAALTALGGCSSTPKQETKPAPTGTAGEEQSAAAEMVTVGQTHTESFLKMSQTEAIRNMMGAARAVFISPEITGGAAILGYEGGTGFLVCRRGSDFSDPVFFKLSGTSVGFQAGGKTQRTLILIMTDDAVDKFVSGTMSISGTGGFAIGPWGFGGAGAGGITGGLEMVILSTNKGAFLGSSWSGLSPKAAPEINAAIYGPGVDPKTILAVPGGRYAPANAIRASLSKMVVQSWDTEGGRSPASPAAQSSTKPAK